MTDSPDISNPIFSNEDPRILLQLHDLVRRMQLWPQLLLRQIEEKITHIVPIDPDFIESERVRILGDLDLNDFLAQHHWSLEDFDLHISRPEALRLYSEHRFGPGIEETFLSSGSSHDQVIYSVLRVRDPSLLQELWIRLEEGEATFADLASSYGEGPEAARKGVLGPISIGNIVPHQLASLLKSLQVGQIHPPSKLGDFFVLVRLEQLTPARLDSDMRKFLLNQQFNSFMDSQVKLLLGGHSLDSLNFDYHP